MYQGVVSLQLFSRDLKHLTCTRLSCEVGSGVQKHLRGSASNAVSEHPDSIKFQRLGSDRQLSSKQLLSNSKSRAW